MDSLVTLNMRSPHSKDAVVPSQKVQCVRIPDKMDFVKSPKSERKTALSKHKSSQSPLDAFQSVTSSKLALKNRGANMDEQHMVINDNEGAIGEPQSPT